MSRNRARTSRLVAQHAAVLATLAVAGALSGCGPADSGASGSSSDSDSQSAQPSAVEAESAAETRPAGNDSDAAADGDRANRPGDDQPAPTVATVEHLTAQAERLWSARVQEDWATVFEYQQFRTDEDITVEDFVAWSNENEPFVVQSYEIREVTVDEDMGWTKTQYDSTIRQYPNSPPRTSTRVEKWQIVDGQWKLIPPDKADLYPASPTDRDLEQEAVLLERFKDSWTARENEQWQSLYEMTDPRDRDDVSFNDFAEAKSLTSFIDYEIEWVEVLNDVGTVRVRIEHKIDDPNLQKLPSSIVVVDERWVRVDGSWYMDLTQAGDSE